MSLKIYIPMSSDGSFYEQRTACRAQNNFWTEAGHDDQPIKILSDQVSFLTSQNQYWIKAN